MPAGHLVEFPSVGAVEWRRERKIYYGVASAASFGAWAPHRRGVGVSSLGRRRLIFGASASMVGALVSHRWGGGVSSLGRRRLIVGASASHRWGVGVSLLGRRRLESTGARKDSGVVLATWLLTEVQF